MCPVYNAILHLLVSNITFQVDKFKFKPSDRYMNKKMKIVFSRTLSFHPEHATNNQKHWM